MNSKTTFWLISGAIIVVIMGFVFLFYRLGQIEKRLNRLDPWGAKASEESPDEEALGKISFPANPTKETLRQYVFDILAATRSQHRFKPDDPQVNMLLRVGEENIDVLIGVARLCDIHTSYHINMAIKQLATEQNKSVIINSLPDNKNLVWIVVTHKWQNEARDILIRELKKKVHLPVEWIQAVSDLQDPSTYDLLVNHFINSDRKYDTYNVIKDLPGIGLEAHHIEEAWERTSKRLNPPERVMMATIAIGYGKEDALEILVDGLYTVWYVDLVREALLKHTEGTGDNDQIMDWYKTNKDSIFFDKETRKFKVRK